MLLRLPSMARRREMNKMKKLLAFLYLIPAFALAQFETQNIPVVSTTTIASCVTTSASTSVSAEAKPFGSVTVGMAVFGPGVPIGTTVASLPDPTLDSIIVLSAAATASATVSLQFGYFASAAYTSGDWVGFPFKVTKFPTGASGTIKLISAEIADSADVIGATDILFFSSLSGSSGLDNAAAAVPGSDYGNILGLVSLTTVTDVGAMKMLTKDDINLELPIISGGTIWARLIARTGPTLTAVTNYLVRLRFK